MSCACTGRGLVTIHYQSHEPPDVGICTCEAGRSFRRLLTICPDELAASLGVTADRVWPIEDLADDKTELLAWGVTYPSPRERPDYTQAGKRRAKL